MYTRLTGLLFGALFLASCVTINIYFPAAQAQQAADKIVGEIMQAVPEQGDGTPAETSAPPKAGGDQGGRLPPASDSLWAGVLEFFVPSAHAGKNFNIDTPEIRRLKASMKRRLAALAPFLNSGAVGLTGRGLLALRDASKVSLKQRAQVERLLKAENAERNRLYRAVAQANGHPEWEPEVRAVFARSWIRQARRGWWYQDPANGRWKRK